MSVAAVIELSQELHRLAIAGVGLAKGDKRITALLPTMAKSGEKAPVFARIAEQAKALVSATKADAPAQFLQLNTLVGAVLKTQGQSGVQGEIAPLGASSTSSKQIPAQALYELHDSIMGYHEHAIRAAIKNGWFGDARLAPMALDALQSEYAKLSNLAATKMLPAYGNSIIPLLVASLDLSQKRPAARMIETVSRVDSESAAALARQILDPQAIPVFDIRIEGVTISDDAKAAAIRCLASDELDHSLLSEHITAKKKLLRTAALSNLLAQGDDEAQSHVVAMLDGSATKAREAIECISAIKPAQNPALGNQEIVDRIVALSHKLVKTLGSKKIAVVDASMGAHLLNLLHKVDTRADVFEATFALFKRLDVIFHHRSAQIDLSTSDLLNSLVSTCPESKMLELYLTGMDHSGFEEEMVLAVIQRLGPVTALPLLQQAKLSTLRSALDDLFGLYAGSDIGLYSDGVEALNLPEPSQWNKQWLALACEYGLIDLIEYLWPLDPKSVMAWIFTGKKGLPDGLASLALVVDPSCAATLQKRLHKSNDDFAHLQALCTAIVHSNFKKAIELVGELPEHHGRHRIAALGTRLTDHMRKSAA